MPADDELGARIRELVLRILAEEPGVQARPNGIAIGADHGGLDLKQNLVPYLSHLGCVVTDCGTFTSEAVDYPDIAYSVARLVGAGRVSRGIIIDGAGIGSCMVANKVPGVRAAMCYDTTTARNAREHNDANVLTLGGKLIQAATAREIVRIFLEVKCTEPRHQRRVAKIIQVEKRYLRR